MPPQVTEEEKAAAKAARQARLAAATKMRIGEVARRLKAAKDAGEHQLRPFLLSRCMQLLLGGYL
eukprot:1144103-Pelagomonas_calceolata.AAC.1